jgi:hypothetical protein
MGSKSAARSLVEQLKTTVSSAAQSVDTSQVNSSALEAQSSLKASIETSLGSIAGDIEGGIQGITQKFDKFQNKLNNLTTEGLVTDAAQSLENMATDIVTEAAQQFLSKFGATVSVTFSEPDSNGIVYPISASLVPEGGISGTIAAVLQLITGLGVGPGSLQKVLVEATPEGLITAGKNILAGKFGAFDGAELVNSLAEEAITSVTDKLESEITSSLSTYDGLNTTVATLTSVDTDGAGNLLVTKGTTSSTGSSATTEFNSAINNIKNVGMSDLRSVVTDAKNIKQTVENATSDLENLSGGKNSTEVLNAVETSATKRQSYSSKGDNYRSLVKTRVAKNSETGIVQGINTEVLTDVKKRIKDFAPKLSAQQVNQVIALSQGDAKSFSDATRLLVTETGKSSDEVKGFLKTIDTTIYNSTRPDKGFNVFGEPYVIGSFDKAWKNGKNNPVFPYISSVEELQAEFRNINRQVTEMVAHWTETQTNKNLSSEDINKYHLDIGLDGIGYHYVIQRDGSLQRGRPINIEGQHAPVNNHDQRSIGVVFVGGINAPTGTPNYENFFSAQSLTRSQINTFDHLCRTFYNVFPGGQIVGHTDIDDDEIDPGFSVIDYVRSSFGKISKFKNPLSQESLTVDEILTND